MKLTMEEWAAAYVLQFGYAQLKTSFTVPGEVEFCTRVRHDHPQYAGTGDVCCRIKEIVDGRT